MSWLRRAVGPGSVPGQYMWDLRWTKWHWDMFLAGFLVFPSHYHSTNTPCAFIHPAPTLYTQPVFYACLYYAFSLNALYQFTPLVKLRPVVFALAFFGWFISIYLSIFFLCQYDFLFTPTFSGTQLWHKTRPSYTGWFKYDRD